MAEIALHYYPTGSSLHRTDPRFKTVAMLVIAPAVFASGWPGLSLLSVLLCSGVPIARVPARLLLKELRYFSILVCIVIAARVLFPQDAGSRVQDLLDGLMYGWRLVLVAVASIIFTATTMISEMQDAVVSLTRRIPRFPSVKLATMIGLSVSFVPLLLDQAAKLRNAGVARCVQNARSPLRRISSVGFPLILATFRRADSIAMAMAARCYDGQTRSVSLRSRPADWLFLSGVLAACLAAILYGRV